MTKRRLQLMPEVLPAPMKVGTSAVRARTMARLRVMAAVGASIAAACAGKTEPNGGGSSSGGGSSGGGPDGGLPDPTKPGQDAGYGVVDPLPPPACFDYATPPTATAVFGDPGPFGVDAGADPDAGMGGARYVKLTVVLNQKDVAVGEIETSGNDQITIAKQDLKAGEVDLVLRQFSAPGDDRNFETRVQIQTSCAKGPTRVFVSVSEIENGAGKFDIAVNFSGGG